MPNNFDLFYHTPNKKYASQQRKATCLQGFESNKENSIFIETISDVYHYCIYYKLYYLNMDHRLLQLRFVVFSRKSKI